MLYILIVIGIVLAESKIKKQIDENRNLGDREEILGGRIVLKKQYNRGMLLNFMEDGAEKVKIMSGVILGALLLIFVIFLPKKNKKLFKLGLSLCLGGAISNTADRMTKGHVVDYFSFNCTGLKHVVFNLADMFLLFGSMLMMVSSLFSHKDKSCTDKASE